MIRHILFAFLLCLPLTTSLKEVPTGLNVTITQTKFVLRDNQILVQWNKVSGFSGEYIIEYQNYWPYDSASWVIMSSRNAEVTLKGDLICGSTYRIKISYSTRSITYFDTTRFHVGKSVKLLPFSLDHQHSLDELTVSWTHLSKKTNYVVQLESPSSCEYKFPQYDAKSQNCLIPNKGLKDYLKICNKSCGRSMDRRITFKNYQLFERYIVSIFVTQEDETTHFCEPIWTNKVADVEYLLSQGKYSNSSTTYNKTYAASNGNDGNFSNRYNSDCFENSSFWWVDLGQVYKINRIYVANRKHEHAYMFRYITLSIGKELNKLKKCAFYEGPSKNGEELNIQCEGLGRFVELKKIIPGCFFFNEVQVYGTLPYAEYLLSQGKRSVQSSTWWSNKGGTPTDHVASKGNDGNTSSVFCTEEKPNSYWQVDLGQVYHINKVRMINQNKWPQEKLQNVVISIGIGEKILNECANYTGPTQRNETIDKICKGLGRYVNLKQMIPKWFHLAEAQVFGALPYPTEVKLNRTSDDTISIEWQFYNQESPILLQIEMTSYFGTEYRSCKRCTSYEWKGLPPSGIMSFRVRVIKSEKYTINWSNAAFTTIFLQEEINSDTMSRMKNSYIESEIRNMEITNTKYALKSTYFLMLVTTPKNRKDYPITKYDVTMVTTILNQVIKQGMVVMKKPQLLLKVFDNMLNVSSTLLATKDHESKETTIASDLVGLLDKASQGLNSTEIYKYERIAIAAYDPKYLGNKIKSEEIIVFNPDENKIVAMPSIPETQRLQIAINMSQRMNNKISFTMMDDASLMRAQEKGHKSNIVTSVISANIEQRNINDTMNDISATIDLTPAKKSDSEVVCVSWDPVQVAWSSRGCTTTLVDFNSTDFNSTTRRCQCSHLSSFTILKKVDCRFFNFSFFERILGNISYICLTLSNLCLAFVIVVYSCFISEGKQSSTDSHGLYNMRQSRNILAFSVTLFCANMVLIVGGYFLSSLDSKSISCKMIGGLLHFGYLSSIIWSFIEAATVGNSIVRLHSSNIPDFHVTNYFLKASVICWGLPALIITLTAGIYRGENYGYDVCAGVVDNTVDNIKLTEGGLCFLKQTPFYYAFMTPVALLIGFNLIIMFFILPIILKSTPAVNRANLNATNQSVKGIFGLICMLSLTWIFGFLYISHGKVIFQYIFILTTALQGFFIFVFFILLKPNIRGLVLSPFTIRNLIERRQEQQQRILDLQ